MVQNLSRNAQYTCGGQKRLPYNFVRIIGLVLSGSISLLLIAEFIRIKIIANPQVIAGYYFGSEAMMDHGGWTYRSASLYAWSALSKGLFIFG